MVPYTYKCTVQGKDNRKKVKPLDIEKKNNRIGSVIKFIGMRKKHATV